METGSKLEFFGWLQLPSGFEVGLQVHEPINLLLKCENLKKYAMKFAFGTLLYAYGTLVRQGKDM